MTSYDLYTKTSPLRLFFIVAVPGAIGMIASSLWGLFDGIFVSRFLGETAFAALNLAFPFVLINFSLADLIGVGSSVPISIALGKKQEDEANNYFTCACLMILITSVVMGAIFFVGAPWMMKLVGASDELSVYAVEYLRVYAVCSPFTTIVFAVDNFLRISGKIRTSMMLNIAMSVIILGVEYFFLAVLKMSIGGSALAVSIGMCACALIALYPFFRKKLVLRFCKPRFSWNLIRQVVANGSPNFLSNVAARLTSIIMNLALMRMGGANAVNAYGILMYAGDIVQQLLYGACDSLQPAIGYNWGAGFLSRVKAIEKRVLLAGAVVSVGGALVMFFCPKGICALFLSSSSEELTAMTVNALKIFSFAYLTRWFGFAIQSFFLALEKPLPATILSLANAFVFPVVLLAVLWPLGLNGIWLNTPVTYALVAVLAGIFLVRLVKKEFVPEKKTA